MIFVKDDESKEALPFPVFQWIEPNYHYKFIPYDTDLPQNDKTKGKNNFSTLVVKQYWSLLN